MSYIVFLSNLGRACSGNSPSFVGFEVDLWFMVESVLVEQPSTLSTAQCKICGMLWGVPIQDWGFLIGALKQRKKQSPIGRWFI